MTRTSQPRPQNALRQPGAARKPGALRQQLLLWVCAVVTVALTMGHHWVICRHEGGDAHIELNHAQGHGHHHEAACECDDPHSHHHVDHDDDDHPHGDHGSEPHDWFGHTELLVEFAPQQEPDSLQLPLLLAFELPTLPADQQPWLSTTKHVLSPPATGPPRPRRFLSLRKTTLLLI